MGSISCQDFPLHQSTIFEDLKVKFLHSTLVLPNPIDPKPESKSYYLSSLDQSFNYKVSSLHFFSANPDFPLETVIQRLKMAVEKVLVTYDFAAGRVRRSQDSGRLEIDCDGSGAGFVEASSEMSIDEIGDLLYPHPGYKQLAVQTLDNISNNDDQPPCIFQVTSFKCGGFSLGLTTNHMLFDGTGVTIFLENVASQAFDNKPLTIIPYTNRHLLAARSPPRVAFPHPELIPKKNIPVSNCVHEELESKIFKLTASQINYLKEKAKCSGGEDTVLATPTKITGFNVVVALIWRCKALSMDFENDRVSTVLCAADIRSRLSPSLPPSYCGNAVINAYSSMKRVEIEEAQFSELVRVVSDGVRRVTDEYVRSTLDWMEINDGVPNGEYFISSWWRLGIEKVVFPWGKQNCSFPLLSQNKYVCFLLPPQTDDEMVNVIVTLPIKEMVRFESLFEGFFQY